MMDSTEFEPSQNQQDHQYLQQDIQIDEPSNLQKSNIEKSQIKMTSNEIQEKYSLPFQNCLNGIKNNILMPNLTRMKESNNIRQLKCQLKINLLYFTLSQQAQPSLFQKVLQSVNKNSSQECFDSFSQQYLSKLLQIIKSSLHDKEYEKAIELLIFLDELTQPHNYGWFHHIRITCLLFIGHYFRCVGDDHSAFQVVEQALTIVNQHGSHFLKGLTYLNLGSLLSKLNDSQQAIKFFKASVASFGESNLNLVSQIREGQQRKKTQAFIYSHQNQSLALHNLGIEYEKDDDVEMAFLSYYNSYMNSRDHLGSHHQLTKNFHEFLKKFVKKLDWQFLNVENLFDDPNSYLNIIRKQKKISNPYFETFETEHMQKIANQFIKRLGKNQKNDAPLLNVNKSKLQDKGSTILANNKPLGNDQINSTSKMFSSQIRNNSVIDDYFQREEFHSILLATEEYEQQDTMVLQQSQLIDYTQKDLLTIDEQSDIHRQQTEDEKPTLSKFQFNQFIRSQQKKIHSHRNLLQQKNGNNGTSNMKVSQNKISDNNTNQKQTTNQQTSSEDIGTKSTVSNMDTITIQQETKRSSPRKINQRPFSGISNISKQQSQRYIEQNTNDSNQGREITALDITSSLISPKQYVSTTSHNQRNSYLMRTPYSQQNASSYKQLSFSKYLEKFDDKSFHMSYMIHQSQLRQIKQKDFVLQGKNQPSNNQNLSQSINFQSPKNLQNNNRLRQSLKLQRNSLNINIPNSLIMNDISHNLSTKSFSRNNQTLKSNNHQKEEYYKNNNQNIFYSNSHQKEKY